jgi:hypothetical protein
MVYVSANQETVSLNLHRYNKDTESGLGAGMVANEDRSMREGFAAAYSDAHAVGRCTSNSVDP